MRKLFAAILILGLMAISPMEAAKKKHKKSRSKKPAATQPLKWFADFGPSVPMGDLGNIAGIGFSLGGGAEHTLGFGTLVYKLHYSKWGGKDVLGLKWGSTSAIDAMVDYKYKIDISGSVAPYLIGGAGLRRASFDLNVLGFTTSASSTTINIELGGGVDVPVGNMLMFFEAGLNIGGDYSDFPIRVGLRF